MSLPALINSTDFESHPLFLVESEYNEKIDDLILEWQDEYIKKILGERLFIDYVNDYDLVTEDWLTQKWKDFNDGYNYTVNGYNVTWSGLRNLLKYLLFFEYRKYNRAQHSALGKTNPNMQNAEHSEDFTSVIQIYNKGVYLHGFDYECKFIEYNKNIMTYKKVFDKDIEKFKPTAYNFLLNRESEFDNWIFTNIFEINSFM
ncbi:MAG: hypothetical protein GF317_23450 [Candidatus Lokiarchaeota archaeon]|nr:hypothetical protein [Candidatus Lokiarchaeota archaeon]